MSSHFIKTTNHGTRSVLRSNATKLCSSAASLFLLTTALVPTSALAWTAVVSGAGLAGFNGTYTKEANSNEGVCTPSEGGCQRLDGVNAAGQGWSIANKSLYFDTSNNMWYLYDYVGVVAYEAAGTADAPPTSGWRVYTGSGWWTTTTQSQHYPWVNWPDNLGAVPTVTLLGDGTCGSAAGVASAFMPAKNLCSAGTAGQVAAGGTSWSWECAGAGSGSSSATCTAPFADTNIGGIVGAIQVDESSAGWEIDQGHSGFAPLPAPAPAGVIIAGGATNVRLITGTAGTSATVTLRFSSIPAGAQLYKYGKENGASDTDKWFVFPAIIDATAGTVTYTLTDGQKGDNDWTENSVIDDPVALGTAGAVAGIPTLSESGMIILSGLLALGTFVTMRRRRV